MRMGAVECNELDKKLIISIYSLRFILEVCDPSQARIVSWTKQLFWLRLGSDRFWSLSFVKTSLSSSSRNK